MANQRLIEKITDLADAIGIDALGLAGASQCFDRDVKSKKIAHFRIGN